MDAIAPLLDTRTVLRFSTAGSVDDGKSTLIGRLLYDAKALCQDQIEQVERSSLRRGLVAPDLSLITDGLIAEREQGITIDVAYRYFATPNRKYIIADTPGHEQYTRNMVTGASTSDLTIVLVDATRGVQVQSRRHAAIASLLGVPHLVVAINKMDRVDWSETRFRTICDELSERLKDLSFARVEFVPVSALTGDNITTNSPNMPWYSGAPLLSILEMSRVTRPADQALRMPVQWVCRPDGAGHHERIYMGRIEAGELAVGDIITISPSGQSARVSDIRIGATHLNRASAPRSVGVTLDRDIDIARGDIFSHAEVAATSQLRAKIAWLDATAQSAGNRYWLKAGAQTARAVVTAVHSRLNIETLAQEPANNLVVNDLGEVSLRLQTPLALDPYRVCRATGSFILIDETTHRTVAGGMVI